MRGVVTNGIGASADVAQSSTGKAGVGTSSPLGATVFVDGVNFSVFSRNASNIELLLFDREDDRDPSHVVTIDPFLNRTYHYWHTFVPGITAGQIYAYRVDGKFDPGSGLRFDPSKALLDPYGRGVAVPKSYNREAIRKTGI